MSDHETPADIIESLTRQHTHDGYTGHFALCESLKSELHKTLAELDQYRGHGLVLARGEHLTTVRLHRIDLPALAYVTEVEADDIGNPATIEVSIVRVLVNGQWHKAQDVADEYMRDEWADEEREALLAEAAVERDERRTEAQRAWREAA